MKDDEKTITKGDYRRLRDKMSLISKGNKELKKGLSEFKNSIMLKYRVLENRAHHDFASFRDVNKSMEDLQMQINNLRHEAYENYGNIFHRLESVEGIRDLIGDLKQVQKLRSDLNFAQIIISINLFVGVFAAVLSALQLGLI